MDLVWGGYGKALADGGQEGWVWVPPVVGVSSTVLPIPSLHFDLFPNSSVPPALILINILMVLGLGLGLSASVRLVLEGVFIPCSCLT